jgi:hypothetical protein
MSAFKPGSNKVIRKAVQTIVSMLVMSDRWKWQSIDSDEPGKVQKVINRSREWRQISSSSVGYSTALWITGPMSDKWSVEDLIVHHRQTTLWRTTFCADRGYDFEDVHEVVYLQGYLEHIKHKQKRNEPKTECHPR